MMFSSTDVSAKAIAAYAVGILDRIMPDTTLSDEVIKSQVSENIEVPPEYFGSPKEFARDKLLPFMTALAERIDGRTFHMMRMPEGTVMGAMEVRNGKCVRVIPVYEGVNDLNLYNVAVSISA